jgi:hypothetical protein
MSLAEPVAVRLDVEFLKHSIRHAFTEHTDGLKELISQEVDRVIRTFNWQQEVSAICADVMRDIVRQQITGAMSQLRWDEALHKELAEAVLRELVGTRKSEPGV